MSPAGKDGVEARNIERASASTTNIIYHVRYTPTINLPA